MKWKLGKLQWAKAKARRGAARVSVTRAHAEIMLLDKAYVCDMIEQVKFLSLKTVSVLFQRRPWEKLSSRDASLKYSGEKKINKNNNNKSQCLGVFKEVSHHCASRSSFGWWLIVSACCSTGAILRKPVIFWAHSSSSHRHVSHQT